MGWVNKHIVRPLINRDFAQTTRGEHKRGRVDMALQKSLIDEKGDTTASSVPDSIPIQQFRVEN